ncbi:hypothetical protein HID58_035581 [Brassica napus]|uniref:Uncharacterized protein n=1 Tax=Brassica napus TaxID=3708 RepID=A0ABQ8C5B0_BRANA|nr:hypothetical protein HID58_035581 [Brassica napus]
MTTEIEPQSLQKLSLKSVKRALDLFSPAQISKASKKIRLSHKFQVAFGGVEPVSKQSIRRDEYNNNEQIASSSALALPGPQGAKQGALVVGPTLPPRSYDNTGHLGWVRSVAFDPSNEWFCTGSADGTIKVWDVASGVLKVTLTGHIGQVRGLAVSNKDTSYMFSAGRDSVCRVWDIRTKTQSFALSGHDKDVCSVFTPPTHPPQVVTGSHDSTIKFWDLRYGRTMTTLTNHKKAVRAMALHPKENENAFVSASADNINKFSLNPKGEFRHNMLSQQRATINAVAVNEDGVMVTGGDNGSLWFWDWKSGHSFQQAEAIVQPGSLESEAGIYAACYDQTGSRLVTCEADKTIKMWKEDDNATPETHPLNFRPPKEIRRF